MLTLYLVLINLLSFIAFGMDKRRAKKGAWRIPEATLLAWAIMGGSVGSGLGMLVFRHKTKHIKFALGIPLILAVQILVAFQLL